MVRHCGVGVGSGEELSGPVFDYSESTAELQVFVSPPWSW